MTWFAGFHSSAELAGGIRFYPEFFCFILIIGIMEIIVEVIMYKAFVIR